MWVFIPVWVCVCGYEKAGKSGQGKIDTVLGVGVRVGVKNNCVCITHLKLWSAE